MLETKEHNQDSVSTTKSYSSNKVKFTNHLVTHCDFHSYDHQWTYVFFLNQFSCTKLHVYLPFTLFRKVHQKALVLTTSKIYVDLILALASTSIHDLPVLVENRKTTRTTTRTTTITSEREKEKERNKYREREKSKTKMQILKRE